MDPKLKKCSCQYEGDDWEEERGHHVSDGDGGLGSISSTLKGQLLHQYSFSKKITKLNFN